MLLKMFCMHLILGVFPHLWKPNVIANSTFVFSILLQLYRLDAQSTCTISFKSPEVTHLYFEQKCSWQIEMQLGRDSLSPGLEMITLLSRNLGLRGACAVVAWQLQLWLLPGLLLAVTPDTGPRLSNMALMQLSRVTGSKQLKLMTRQLTGQQTVLSFWCWYFPRKHSAKYKISISLSSFAFLLLRRLRC